jgi:hypothetical protein
LHIGLVSLFLSILSLRGRLNIGNKKQSHIYLNLFISILLQRNCPGTFQAYFRS